MERERFLTVAEVADILRLKPRTIHKHLKEGRLEGVLFGREWRISQAALDAYIGAAVDRTGRGRLRMEPEELDAYLSHEDKP